MDKLELKDLCGYLPYKLKVKRGERILVMNTGQGSSTHWVGISAVLKWFNSEMISKPIPLLLPLSALTEPLEDGSVPIVELSRLRDKTFRIDNWGYSEDNGHFVQNGLYHTFGFKNNSFYMYFNNETMDDGYCELNNQLQLFEYLYAHHFDIYGLIGQGLAIDKRTVK